MSTDGIGGGVPQYSLEDTEPPGVLQTIEFGLYFGRPKKTLCSGCRRGMLNP
jgi:hypothetical protein